MAGQWRILVEPGIYHISIGATVAFAVITVALENRYELKPGLSTSADVATGQAPAVVDSAEGLLVRVIDQAELISLLGELHGLGVPLLSIKYLGAP